MSVDQFLLSSDTTDLNYPEIRPTLDLNFARVKALDPRITFTRSSGGSYVGADGTLKYAGVNEARFDHNPTTGESLGLLVEEQRTNRLLRSEEFDSASWNKSNASIVANAATAPSGTDTADRFAANNGIIPNAAALIQDAGASAATTYTFSIYAKAAGQTSLRFQMNARNPNYLGDVRSDFNFTTGAFGLVLTSGTPPTGVSFSAQSLPNEWYRLIVTGTTPATTSLLRCALYNSATGDGVNGFLAWGAQLEVGAFPTSYIPTTTSSTTRAADNASITGTNFSSWYRQDEGTVYSNTRMNGVQTGRFDRLWAITNSNLNREGISVFVSGPVGGGSGAYVSSITITNSATEQIVETLVESAITTPNLRSAFAFATNNSASAYNGNLRFVDKSVILLSNPDRLLIGQPQRFQGTSCMTISRLIYYPKALPNSQLQALTR